MCSLGVIYKSKKKYLSYYFNTNGQAFLCNYALVEFIEICVVNYVSKSGCLIVICLIKKIIVNLTISIGGIFYEYKAALE